MFNKFGKQPEGSQGEQTLYPHQGDLRNRPTHPFTSDLMNAIDPSDGMVDEQGPAEEEVPETIIAQGVSITGTLSFQKLVRIDGNFEGELRSSGKLIVGPTGTIQSDIDLEEAFIAGKVIGDIKVKKRLVLRGRAEVRGNITAPVLSVDEGVLLVGTLNIAPVEAQDESAFDEDHYSPDH